MFAFNRKTRKLYYEDPHLDRCQAKVTRIGAAHFEFDTTVAYPEGGGQDSDHGTIGLADGRLIRFIHAKRLYGNRTPIDGFPDIQLDGIIEHIIHPDDMQLLAEVREGQEVEIKIDRLRRAQLSLSHTASHLVYLGVQAVRPDAVDCTLGCHIRTDAARFDFGIKDRISEEQLQEIERLANAFIARGSEVMIYSHASYSDARYWECESNVIPCGGTHIQSTAPISQIKVRRKSMGTGKERVSCTFDQATYAVNSFHA
jgi:Ser-tRNA(Ala) deacylase AlaX